jgi:hypothetical protein
MGWLCHPFVLVYSKPYKGKLAEFGEPLFANCDFAARDFCSSVLWHFYTWEWLSTIG